MIPGVVRQVRARAIWEAALPACGPRRRHGGRREVPHGAALVGARRDREAVDRRGRYECVPRYPPRQQSCQGPHHPRRIGGGVHDRVPGSPFQRREVPIAVARQALDPRVEDIRGGPAPVEHAHLVPVPRGGLDHVSTDEPRAPEYQHLHPNLLPFVNEGHRLHSKNTAITQR